MMSSAPSVIGRLAEAAERFVSTRTEPEVLTGLETVLTELAGVERFAILRDGGRRDPELLRRALVTYSIDVGRSRHVLAILRLRAGCELDGVCDRLLDFATYEAGRRLTRTAAARRRASRSWRRSSTRAARPLLARHRGGRSTQRTRRT